MSALTSYSELAKELALTVGKKLNTIIQAEEELEISHKDTVDLVTKWDLWSEKTISEGILNQFPTHNIIGEESADLSAIQATLNEGIHWIIDPIDGTTNFTSRLPHYGVSIGVLVDGVPSVGVVYDPSKGELFHAIRGNGAFLNDKKIKVSNKNKLINSVVATGFSYERAQTWAKDVGVFSEVLIKCRDIRRWGAASLDVCYVACGRFDAYFEADIKLWDIAGGHVVLTEAGGTGRSFKERIGSKLILPKDYCCGSGESFEELLKIVHGPKGD